jgi:hypothetical protein
MSSNDPIEISANDNVDLCQTVIERMGGYPKYWLEGTSDLSERSVRKKAIADKIQSKHQSPNKSLVIRNS